MSGDIAADVVIVGSGVAGALLAARLAAAGVKVAILEAGAKVDRGDATQRFRDAVIKVPECPYPATPEAMHPDLQRSGFLVPPARPRQIQEHLCQGRGRHDLALARHLLAFPAP